MTKGEKWVTIKGHHVLINANGTPVNKADQKLLDSANRNSAHKGSKAHYDKIKEWEHKFETAETTEDIDRLQDEINDYTRDVLNKDNTLDDRDRNHLESRMRDLYRDTNRRKESFEGKNTEPSYEDKKQYLKDKGLAKHVKELNADGNNEKAAVEYVYDQNTLSKEDFDKKYGVTEGMRKTKSAVFKNDPAKSKNEKWLEGFTKRKEAEREANKEISRSEKADAKKSAEKFGIPELQYAYGSANGLKKLSVSTIEKLATQMGIPNAHLKTKQELISRIRSMVQFGEYSVND